MSESEDNLPLNENNDASEVGGQDVSKGTGGFTNTKDAKQIKKPDPANINSGA